MSDIGMAIDGIFGSLPGYGTARAYDEIDIWAKVGEDSRLTRTLRQADVEFDPNFCSVVVDSRTDRMKIEGVTVADNGPAATALDMIVEANKMNLYYPTWQRKSIRDGDGYILAWPMESEDEDAPALGFYRPDQINITYIDPTRGRIFYDEQNPRIVKFFAQLYSEAVPGTKHVMWHMELLYPDRIEHYATPPRSPDYEGITAEDFAPYVPGLGRLDIDTDLDSIPDDVWPDENPTGRVPVFHLATDLPYGKPEARNAFGPQDAMSKLVEIQMVTVNFLGWPQLYALQEAQQLAQHTIREDPLADMYPGDADQIDSEDRDTISQGVTNETGSNFEFSPGSIALFKGFKDVGQFTAADPVVLLEPLREQMKIVSGTTGTPLHRFVGSGEPPSGESLKVANAPTNNRADRLKDLFGSALADAYEFALELCGFVGVKVTIEWSPSEKETETERWTNVKLRRDAGVPYVEAMIMAGIPKEQAEEWEARRNKEQEIERQHALALAAKSPAPSNEKIPASKSNSSPAPSK